MEGLVFELALIVGIAAVLAIAARLIRQPPIIAYLIAGALSGPLVFNLLESKELIQAFSHLGIAFLLFVVGLSLDFRILKDVGKVAFMACIVEVLLVSAISFGVAVLLGFDYLPAFFIAAALTFSSTVVVVKILSDKKEMETLHGKIALGILILQDFVAAVLLMTIPVLSGTGAVTDILIRLGEALLLIGGVFLVSYLILPGILGIIARNQEILFLFSVAWALIVAVSFDQLGFSLEIGSLLAGMALASSKYNLEIQGKIKGLRDFFVIMLFVFFGSQLIGPITSELILQAVVFSALVLIGKPIVIMSFMKILGYKKRTNFFIGVGFAQISEFSLILVLLGMNLGLIGQELLSLIILVALITIGLSSYGIYYSQAIFSFLAYPLGIFDGNKHSIEHLKKRKEYEIVLIGYNRVGFNLLKLFNASKKDYLVVDYNPATISDLAARGVHCVYGDANDLELLNELELGKAKMIISTVPDLDTNFRILESIKNPKTIFIPTSHNIQDTMALYKRGATYVIMPHFLGGEHVAHLLDKYNFDGKNLFMEGRKQIKELNERLIEGHTHPSKELFGK